MPIPDACWLGASGQGANQCEMRGGGGEGARGRGEGREGRVEIPTYMDGILLCAVCCRICGPVPVLLLLHVLCLEGPTIPDRS